MMDSDRHQADYDALTAGDGFYQFSDWSIVEMTGDDRQLFLHNMCTHDILSLSPGDACEAFCTDVRGKITAHVLILAQDDRLDLLTVPGQAETLIAHLDRYIIREDVSLRDTTNENAWSYACDRDTATELSSSAGETAVIFGCNFCGLPGYLTPTEKESGSQGCCSDAWEAVRIEAGLPLFGADFDNSHLPQEVNRDQMAINFNKGCYLGQETIARIDALGHVNQKIVFLQFAGDTLPVVGDELHSGDKVVGRVTSSCWSPKMNSPIALAMVRRGSNDRETQLESAAGTATVVPPVVQPG